MSELDKEKKLLMKNKLSFISIFTLCIALSLTACGGKQSSNTDSKNTQTEAGTEASGKSDSRLDDLYQQENQLFADHADVWNKAFGMMNKSDADPNGNYADYLADTVESNKNSFTDDELKILNFFQIVILSFFQINNNTIVVINSIFY